MACDYQNIRRDNERRYGTDIGRIGQMLLAERYDDRSHFIYELLQNAEDALAKRSEWSGNRSVLFELSDSQLTIEHFGKPFDEPDVRGVCGIAESTKDLTAIGRFGIGFKSVYAVSNCPEVHSGEESFAIDSFVWPRAAPDVDRATEKTIICLPLKEPQLKEEIAAGLVRLGPSALLFLREIDQIEWRIEGSSSGIYMRSQPESLGEGIREIDVLGQTKNEPDVTQKWRLFSRPMFNEERQQAGFVEIAFQLENDDTAKRWKIRRIPNSPLSVFFPTVVETHLGFLIQGPYRTTPSRDNVPALDPWNQACVEETADLLVEALRWFRDRDELDVGTFESLPLDPDKFRDGTMFAPLYERSKQALETEPLLPRHGGGHLAAENAKLARTRALRELLEADQVTALFEPDTDMAWLSGDISQDRSPELREYLMQELGVEEVTPPSFLAKVTEAFLEAQSADWIRRLYEFLNDQPALAQRVADVPTIRLKDGRHVHALVDGQPQAFLPGNTETSFPTVHPDTCSSTEARSFLQSLGLNEPDPVDDVIRNILPKYQGDEVNVDDEIYESDIARILAAAETDSTEQRDKLLSALRETSFVMSVDCGDGTEFALRPDEVYLSTDRLKSLFAGVKGVLRVDDRYACLRGEAIRSLLESLGGTRYLLPTRVASHLSESDKKSLRRSSGLERAARENPVSDYMVRGLEELLEFTNTLPQRERKERAAVLWLALADMAERRGSTSFLGEYTWGYFHENRTVTFEASFVSLLNQAEWIPQPDKTFAQPSTVIFADLSWPTNAILESRIKFKPPIVDQLAKEAGIEPAALDLLKRLGVTSEAALREHLGELLKRPEENEEGKSDEPDTDEPDTDEPDTDEPDTDEPDTDEPDTDEPDTDEPDTDEPDTDEPDTDEPGVKGGDKGKRAGGSRKGSRGKRKARKNGGRQFISYVATQPDEDDQDPDGLDHENRMNLEEEAIAFIESCEPFWKRTPKNNAGFDLFESGYGGKAVRWCEVKAMTGSLEDRPVGLSQTQFEHAQMRGEDYWLYVVEHAGDEKNQRIVRIQNPAGKARTFTYDHGWLSVAQTDSGENDPPN